MSAHDARTTKIYSFQKLVLQLGDEVQKLKGQLESAKDECADKMREYEREMIEIANSVRMPKGMIQDKVSEDKAQRLLNSSPTSVAQKLKRNVDKVMHKVLELEQKLKLNVAKAETAATDAASLKVQLANAEKSQKACSKIILLHLQIRTDAQTGDKYKK